MRITCSRAEAEHAAHGAGERVARASLSVIIGMKIVLEKGSRPGRGPPRVASARTKSSFALKASSVTFATSVMQDRARRGRRRR